jgi:hypothetical protein
MLLIPRLGRRPQAEQQAIANDIAHALASLGSAVVFAELNLALNVLWVSMEPRPGIVLTVTAAVQSRVPEALLVAHDAELVARKQRSWWRRWRRR